jgi:hypothetical protein
MVDEVWGLALEEAIVKPELPGTEMPIWSQPTPEAPTSNQAIE